MRYYGVMYRKRMRADGTHTYDEPCGDRHVVRIDGRLSLPNMMRDAQHWCITHGYDGYRIARGNNLLKLFFITASVQPVEDK